MDFSVFILNFKVRVCTTHESTSTSSVVTLLKKTDLPNPNRIFLYLSQIPFFVTHFDLTL